MGSPDVSSKVILLLIKIISISGLSITNGPQDTTVCMNAIAECDCGFSGASPHTTVLSWRIILRNDNGSVVSNVTHNGLDIARERINGLRWLSDLDNATNSKLLVGPVNKTHNQSSYQCVFQALSGNVISSLGTMTIVGPPSVIINVDEICTTSITISLNTYSHPACGDVSHNVTISGNVIYPDTIDHSKYTIDNLQSDTLYNITVASTYNSSSKLLLTKSVITSLYKYPNPIDATSINIEIENPEIENANCSYVRLRVIWKAPEVDRCSMLEVDHYDVMISSSKKERLQEKFYTTLFYAYLYHSNTTITVSIVVVDTNGQKSDSTVVMKTIFVQNTIANDETVGVPSSTTDGEDCSNLFVILAAVFLATSVIITTISVILAWKLWGQKKENDVVTIPAPAQSLRQLNLDNIEMQPSPAYVSLDSKRPRLYQNI